MGTDPGVIERRYGKSPSPEKKKKTRTVVHGDVIFASKPSQNTGIYNVLWWKGVQNPGFTTKISSPMDGQSGFSDIYIYKGQ